MKTDNEIIAEFMGAKWRKTYGPLTGAEYIEVQNSSAKYLIAQYDYSWDWLMPVVEKITNHVYDEEEVDDGFGGKRIAKYTAYLRTFGMLSSEGKQMVRFNRSPIFEADTLIDATYQAVVDWIKWHNNQKT